MAMTDNGSPSPIQKFRREAECLFASSKQAGLWTHAFGAWGQLSPKGKTEVIKVLPDNRDVFDLASLTKALVTSCLIYQEIDQGLASPAMTLGEWLGDHWPGKLHGTFRNLTLESLLGHTSGLEPWANFWINHWRADGQTLHSRELPGLTTIDRHLDGLSRRPLGPPGEERYSDLGFILLGLGLGLRHQKTLDAQWNRWLSQELQIKEKVPDLGFSPSLAIRDRCVPTSYCALRKRLLVGEVHDENCGSLGGVAGHAGLFGSGESLMIYLRKLHSSKIGKAMFWENQKRLEKRLQTTTNDQGSPPPLLGWRPGDDPSSVGFGEGKAMGHMGFTGVAFWVRPKQNDFAILLTNRICSGRLSRKIVDFRREFFEIAAALG